MKKIPAKGVVFALFCIIFAPIFHLVWFFDSTNLGEIFVSAKYFNCFVFNILPFLTFFNFGIEEIQTLVLNLSTRKSKSLGLNLTVLMTELFSYLESLKFGLNPQVYYYAPNYILDMLLK